MSTTGWLLALVVSSLGVGYAGMQYGAEHATVVAQAKQDHQAVADLTKIISSHAELVDKANAASVAMRKATASRAALDAQTSREFKDALARTEGSRAGCVFPDDVMQQLAAARERAATAAASGVRGALPGTPARTDKQ